MTEFDLLQFSGGQFETVGTGIVNCVDKIKEETSDLKDNIENIAAIAKDSELQINNLKSTVNLLDKKVSDLREDLQDQVKSTQNLLNHLIKYGKAKIKAKIFRTKQEDFPALLSSDVFEIRLQYIDGDSNYTEFSFPIKLESSITDSMHCLIIEKVKKLKDGKVKIILTARRYKRRRSIKLFYIVDLNTKSIIYNYIR